MIGASALAAVPAWPDEPELDNGAAACPIRAPDLDLLGPVDDMAYSSARWMVSLAGGRYFHLTERLYQVLSNCDGRTSCEQIAQRVSADGARIDAARVRRLVRDRLEPAGLAFASSAAATAGSRAAATPLVAIRHKLRLLPYRTTAPLVAQLQHLFAPPLVAAIVTAALLANVWLYARADLGGALHALLFTPGLVLLLLVLDVPLRLFHELGHGSAMRRAGVRHGDIGVALYVIVPVYYTDVTHAYRLGRRDRIRVDLGGIYFDLLATVLLFAVYQLTGLTVLLAAMVVVVLNILREFTPFLRFDGYYLMADLVGVPEPLSLLRPLVADRLPWTRDRHRLPRMSRAAVLALWAYLLVIVAFLLRPALLLSLLGGGAVVSQIGASGAALLHSLAASWSAGQPIGVVLNAIQLVFWLVIPIGLVLFAYALARLGVRALTSLSTSLLRRGGPEQAIRAAARDEWIDDAATVMAQEPATADAQSALAETDEPDASESDVIEPEAEAPEEPVAPVDPLTDAIAAAGRRHADELRSFGAAMSQLFEDRIAHQEREISELRRRLCDSERDRDTTMHSLQTLEAAFTRCVAELRDLGANVSKHAEIAERERSLTIARASLSSETANSHATATTAESNGGPHH